MQLNDIKSDKW